MRVGLDTVKPVFIFATKCVGFSREFGFKSKKDNSLITFATGLATNQIYITAYIFNGETKAWVTGTAAAGTAIGNITATNIWGNSARIAGTISYTAS